MLQVVEREDHSRLIGVIRRRNVVYAYNQAIAHQAHIQHRTEVLRLGKLDGAGFFHLDVPAGAPAVGRHVKEIRLPQDALLVSVRRKRRLMVVHGDTVLNAGDRLTIFSHEDSVQRVREQLTGAKVNGGTIEEVVRCRIVIPEGGRWVGKPLRTLSLPPDCILAGITREGEEMEVDGELIIRAGDEFEVLGEEAEQDKVAAYLGG